MEKDNQKKLAESIQSIVILPYNNFTGNDDYEYFISGMRKKRLSHVYRLPGGGKDAVPYPALRIDLFSLRNSQRNGYMSKQIVPVTHNHPCATSHSCMYCIVTHQ